MSIISPFSSHSIDISTAGKHVFLLSDQEAMHTPHRSLCITVQADNAEVELIGKISAAQSFEKRWDISVALQGKNQSAFVKINAVADDSASITIHGGICIAKTSDNCSAEIHERVVLLSPGAKASITPKLMVETESVKKAAHSASIAPFSEELFFFLETKGISRQNAKKMLAQGVLL